MSQALPRIIKRRAEINQVIQQGEKRRAKYLVAFVQSSSENGLGFCVLVGSKIKKAVKRNRIKRLLKEIVRKNRHPLRIDGGIVLLYSFGSTEVSYTELEVDFKDLFL